MTGALRDDHEDAFLAGYLRGLESGSASAHAAGYADGVAVLDEAAAVLAGGKPSRAVDAAAARARRGVYSSPALTAEQIRVRAAESWGLPPPELPVGECAEADVCNGADVETAQPAAQVTPSLDELTDDDDWAWQA
jgi:hypothetical protein